MTTDENIAKAQSEQPSVSGVKWKPQPRAKVDTKTQAGFIKKVAISRDMVSYLEQQNKKVFSGDNDFYNFVYDTLGLSHLLPKPVQAVADTSKPTPEAKQWIDHVNALATAKLADGEIVDTERTLAYINIAVPEALRNDVIKATTKPEPTPPPPPTPETSTISF